MTLRALILAGLLATSFPVSNANAQDGDLAGALFDAPCAAVIAATAAEAPPFNAVATMSFAGFIAGYASEAEAREMLADFERLDEDFNARCSHQGATVHGAMATAIDEYLDGY